MSPEGARAVNLMIGKCSFFDTAAYSDSTHSAIYTQVLKVLQDLLTQLLVSINVARPECCQNNSCTGCRDLSVAEVKNGALQLLAAVLTLHHVYDIRVSCISNGGGTQVKQILEHFEVLIKEFVDHSPSVAADGLHLTLAVCTRGQNPKDAVKAASLFVAKFVNQHESSGSLKSSPEESFETLKHELPVPNLVTGSLGVFTDEDLKVAVSSYSQAEKNKQTAQCVREWLEGNDDAEPSARMLKAFNSWVDRGKALG